MSTFQKVLFSSPQVAALGYALANGGPLPSTDPHLNALETQGKALMQHHCGHCHGGPTQTVSLPALGDLVRNIMVSKPVPDFAAGLPFAESPVPVRMWAFRTGGAPVIIPSTDPGRALQSGDPAQVGTFDIPSLYGISKTAPYFHDNSAPTPEAMLRHYQSVFEALRRVVPEGTPHPFRPDSLTDDELPPLLAYLTKI